MGWKDNIKMNVMGIGFEDGRWMNVTQDCVLRLALVSVELLRSATIVLCKHADRHNDMPIICSLYYLVLRTL
jgi:hypothetical protein